MQQNSEEQTNSTMTSDQAEVNSVYSTDSLISPPLNPTTNTTSLTNFVGWGQREIITANNVVRLEIDYNVASTSNHVNNDLNNARFPPGYKFCPTDAELIHYYLKRRIDNLPIPFDKIKDVDLYRTTPDKLSHEYEPVEGKVGNEWYVFTPRDRKYPNGGRPNRSTGESGYWKATSNDKNIYHPDHNDQVIGYKKALVYFLERSPKGVEDVKSNWRMYEFRTEKTSSRKRAHTDDMRLDNWVLCKIYRIDKSSEDHPDSTDHHQLSIQQAGLEQETAPPPRTRPELETAPSQNQSIQQAGSEQETPPPRTGPESETTPSQNQPVDNLSQNQHIDYLDVFGDFGDDDVLLNDLQSFFNNENLDYQLLNDYQDSRLRW